VRLDRVSDEFLVGRVKQGDEVAFAELAHRHRPLLGAATRRPAPAGMEAEDVRQAAVMGLFEACRASDGLRKFAGIASLRVRWKVAATRRAAAAGTYRILSDALAGHEGHAALAGRAAPQGSDPARVVELRETLRDGLRERARRDRERAEVADRRARAPQGDLRRRYSDEQINRAVAMVADGSTIAAAAAAVGVPCSATWKWIKARRNRTPGLQGIDARGGPAAGGDLRRRFSDEQARRAVSLVAEGHTIAAAAAAVGASHPTVLRWLRKAA
jgi:transposase-like protein